ncbi:MAG: hypothetical protein JW806_06090 [Sedimentisphaerales bacterium]|nr:hypothetical protein [Sedimentisphaerales bacterium]
MKKWDFSIKSSIVFDTQNAVLGFDVNSAYPLPICRFTDLNSDCMVNNEDLAIIGRYWFRSDCDGNNDFCSGADIDENGSVNFDDFAFLANDWLNNGCQYPCGSEERPFPAADLTRDCIVDVYDLAVIAEEWLNDCNWLNFNCRSGDFDRDGTLNFEDFATFAGQW